jgi:hypothetical protein
MTVYELLEKLDGYILMNKAHVVVDGVDTVVGYFHEGVELVFTPEGTELAALHEATPAKAPKKAKVVQEEQPAVESPQAAPEAAPQE